MKCPKCSCVFEAEDEELRLAKEILSLASKGKKEEIKKLCRRRIDFVGANRTF